MASKASPIPAWAGQGDYGVRFQWGPQVTPALTDGVCVVVDVLRFTTAVEAAVTRDVAVYPYRWRDATAAAFADSVHALLADGRDPAGPSLSPSTMDTLAAVPVRFRPRTHRKRMASGHRLCGAAQCRRDRPRADKRSVSPFQIRP
jgi:hypothetical protein